MPSPPSTITASANSTSRAGGMAPDGAGCAVAAARGGAGGVLVAVGCGDGVAVGVCVGAMVAVTVGDGVTVGTAVAVAVTDMAPAVLGWLGPVACGEAVGAAAAVVGAPCATTVGAGAFAGRVGVGCANAGAAA